VAERLQAPAFQAGYAGSTPAIPSVRAVAEDLGLAQAPVGARPGRPERADTFSGGAGFLRAVSSEAEQLALN
jgi:hypothetical protein